MKKSVVFVAGACLGFCVFAGSEITWTGKGESAAWSDGGNWEGGVAPGLGDIAVLPSGVDVGASQADITYVQAAATKLGGIRLVGDDTKLVVSNLTAATTFDVALSGKGAFQMRDCANGKHLSLKGDNRGFDGVFVVSNAGVRINSEYCLGTTNVVYYYGNSSAKNYFQFRTDHVCDNTFHVRGEWLFYGPNGATINGPVYCYKNVRPEAAGGDLIFSLMGGLEYKTSDGTFYPGNNVRLGGTKPIILGTHDLKPDRGVLRLAAPIQSANLVCSSGGTIIFERANVMPSTMKFRLGTSSTKKGYADLGGYSQQCGDFAVGSNGAMVESSTYLTSAKPATLTVYGTGPSNYNGLLKGAVSLELNSTNSATAGSIGLSGAANTTTGSLIVRRGTMTLLESATFSNVTALVATGAGRLVVNTPEINSTATLTAEGATNLVLNSDITVYSACVDDYYLPVATYDESDGYFTGSGHLTVLVKPVVVKEAAYIGTDDDFANPENWEGGKLPDFEHGEVRVTLGKAGAPATLTIPSGIHVYGIVLKGEVATTLTGEKIFVGSGGVVCEKPVGSTATVANVLDLPFEAEVVPQAWTIPSGVSLQVKKPMSGAAIADYAISISGGGKLTLDADSPDLEPPLDLDNLDLYVNTSYALGSTNRFTKIKTPAGTYLHFGWGLKNYVPIDLSAYGTVNYFGDFARGYEQAGAAKLDLTQSICNGYTFSGGLVGSGQYYTIGIYSYTISGKPMAMPDGTIYNDSTTLNLKSTGNVFGQIRQVNGSTKCQAANALCASGKFVIGRSNTGYTTGTLDLGGFDQDIGAIYNGATATAGDTTIYGTISSAKPATLTSHDATSRTVAMKFTGCAGYAHAGSGTYTFINFANTATNTLSVLAGGVTLKSGAGFPNAKAVHVASGATLTVDKTSESVAFGSAGASRALTTIEEGGTLALTDGAAVTVRRLCVGEKGIEPDVYTAGDPANPWLTGSGSIRVLQPWKPGILLIVK